MVFISLHATLQLASSTIVNLTAEAVIIRLGQDYFCRNKILEIAVKGRSMSRPKRLFIEDEEDVIGVILKIVLRPGHFKQSLDI